MRLVLIFFLQAASAAFTPTFQATIPEVLPEEERYTRALSLSRLAYDLENIVSPMIAALLLVILSYNTLFVATAAGFIASALLVISVALPSPRPTARRGIYDRTTRGIRIYLATPRLRGLLALCLAVSSCGAMVLVNSVVLVRSQLGLEESDLAWAMFAFGAGSMVDTWATNSRMSAFFRLTFQVSSAEATGRTKIRKVRAARMFLILVVIEDYKPLVRAS